jgi:hypothetical protein
MFVMEIGSLSGRRSFLLLINLIAGAMTKPIVEMVWATTDGDMETINRLTSVLVSMNTPADRGKLFLTIQVFYGLMGLQFFDEAIPIGTHKNALEYFIFSFICDFGEIIKDYLVEDGREQTT